MIQRFGSIEIRELTTVTPPALTGPLRRSDILDIAAVTKRNPYQAVLASWLAASHRYAIYYLDQCVGVAGLELLEPSGHAVIWMVGSADLDRALRHSSLRTWKMILLSMSKSADTVSNLIWKENQNTIEWLKLIGFEETAQMSARSTNEPVVEMSCIVGKLVSGLAKPI